MWWFQIRVNNSIYDTQRNSGFRYERHLEKDDVFNVEKWEVRGECAYFLYMREQEENY